METHLRTDNGIDLFCYPNPLLHSFFLALYLRAGPLFERAEEQGITHFFEHAVFRAMQRAEEGTFYRKLDRMGLHFNAQTYSELTCFHLSGTPGRFADAVRILSDVFHPLELSASEVDLERRRIKAELREDGELQSVMHLSRSAVWADTPLEHPITGRPDSLDRIGIKRLRAAQATFLAPDNLFVYATGNVSRQDLDVLSSVIGAVRLGPRAPRNENIAPVPQHFGRRGADIRVKNSEFTSVRFTFDADCAACSEPERAMLFRLLLSGESCLMYRTLSDDTGYAYDPDGCFEQYRNIGNIQLAYEVRYPDLLSSIGAVVEALKKLKAGEGFDLAEVLPAFTDDADMLLDDPGELNWTMAYERHFMDEAYLSVAARRAAFERVTAERLVALARAIFAPENMVLAIGSPGRKVPMKDIRALVESL